MKSNERKNPRVIQLLSIKEEFGKQLQEYEKNQNNFKKEKENLKKLIQKEESELENFLKENPNLSEVSFDLSDCIKEDPKFLYTKEWEFFCFSQIQQCQQGINRIGTLIYCFEVNPEIEKYYSELVEKKKMWESLLSKNIKERPFFKKIKIEERLKKFKEKIFSLENQIKDYSEKISFCRKEIQEKEIELSQIEEKERRERLEKEEKEKRERFEKEEKKRKREEFLQQRYQRRLETLSSLQEKYKKEREERILEISEKRKHFNENLHSQIYSQYEFLLTEEEKKGFKISEPSERYEFLEEYLEILNIKANEGKDAILILQTHAKKIAYIGEIDWLRNEKFVPSLEEIISQEFPEVFIPSNLDEILEVYFEEICNSLNRKFAEKSQSGRELQENFEDWKIGKEDWEIEAFLSSYSEFDEEN